MQWRILGGWILSCCLLPAGCSSSDGSSEPGTGTAGAGGGGGEAGAAGGTGGGGGQALGGAGGQEPDGSAAGQGGESGSAGGASDAAAEAAAGWDGAPLFTEVGTYASELKSGGDPADVYYPNPADLHSASYSFPLALLLQGAKVDKQHYAKFASAVASYGFIVVVPNHTNALMFGGLYPVEGEVVDGLAFFKAQASDATAPIHGVADTSSMVLLGHSYGGVTGMYALSGECKISFCTGGFQRPSELKGGAFYGTNLKPPIGSIPSFDNQGLALLLVQGTTDGKAALADTQETYDKVKGTPKGLVKLKGANHYGVTDSNNPPGADADSSAQPLDHETGVAAIARWSAAFLRAYALGDTQAKQFVQGGAPADPDVETTVTP